MSRMSCLPLSLFFFLSLFVYIFLKIKILLKITKFNWASIVSDLREQVNYILLLLLFRHLNLLLTKIKGTKFILRVYKARINQAITSKFNFTEYIMFLFCSNFIFTGKLEELCQKSPYILYINSSVFKFLPFPFLSYYLIHRHIIFILYINSLVFKFLPFSFLSYYL